MNKWFKSGTPWIWMTGGAVSLSLIAVIGLLLLIGWRGLVYFWPHAIYEWQLDVNGSHETVIGELYDEESRARRGASPRPSCNGRRRHGAGCDPGKGVP